MSNPTQQELAGKLLAHNFKREGPAATALSDPIADTQMVVTLDELRPYDHDPRVVRNPAYAEIKARWPEVIGSDGTLDRKKLGDIVFSDAASRAELNAMTHPRIAAESAQRVQDAAERGEPLAFYEAALIVENNLDAGFDGLVVVTVPEEVQLARLRQRDGISEAPARARVAAHCDQLRPSRSQPLCQTLAKSAKLCQNDLSSGADHFMVTPTRPSRVGNVSGKAVDTTTAADLMSLPSRFGKTIFQSQRIPLHLFQFPFKRK